MRKWLSGRVNHILQIRGRSLWKAMLEQFKRAFEWEVNIVG